METIGASKGRMVGADGVTTGVDRRKGQGVGLRERIPLPFWRIPEAEESRKECGGHDGTVSNVLSTSGCLEGEANRGHAKDSKGRGDAKRCARRAGGRRASGRGSTARSIDWSGVRHGSSVGGGSGGAGGAGAGTGGAGGIIGSRQARGVVAGDCDSPGPLFIIGPIVKSNHDGSSSSYIDRPVEVVAREVAELKHLISTWVIAVDEVCGILVPRITIKNIKRCNLAQSKIGGCRDGESTSAESKSKGGESCNGEHVFNWFWR